MTTHIIPMTYQPKIEGVKDGSCRQTTRILKPMNPKKVDDIALLHGWSGMPYRSPWGWRRKDPLIQVIDMLALKHTASFWQHLVTAKPIGTESCLLNHYPWFGEEMDYLAKLDGISPPTGQEYKNVLEKYHGRFHDFNPVHFQIIRW